MCELLVRVVDKPRSGDAVIDCQRSGRGDVIVVCEDGHDWSREERANPEWMILRVPGMTLSEGYSLAAPELKSPGPFRQLIHKRLFRLDVDAILGPHPGRREKDKVTVYLTDIRAAKQRKPPVPDPYVIGRGPHPDVIG